MLKGIQNAIQIINEDSSANVVLLSSSVPRVFCAGADLKFFPLKSAMENTRKKASSTFRWSKSQSHFLLKVMAEQVRNDMKSGQGFKHQAIMATVRAINNEFKSVQVSEANVSNHLRTLKVRWNQIRRLKDMSGNGWDDNEKKIIMDEAEYHTYIEAHPKEEPLINKPIEMFEEMSLVCSNDGSSSMSENVNPVMRRNSTASCNNKERERDEDPLDLLDVLDALMNMKDKFSLSVLLLANDYLAGNKDIARMFVKRTPFYQEAWIVNLGRNFGGNGSSDN